MHYAELKAVVASNEFNLDRIAVHFGINMKFKWEDTLLLRPDHIKGIIALPEGKSVRIFPFGSIVFANFSDAEISTLVNYLHGLDKSVLKDQVFEYTDDYSIEADATAAPSFNDDQMVIAAVQDFHVDICATVLAKSVALDRIEASIDWLLDEVEEIVGYLHKGRLTLSDEHLAQLSAKILGFKLGTISYVMLLDKPNITWNNNEAAALYDELSAMFELNDRYEVSGRKIDTLMNITEVFSGLVHAKRDARLEWVIIILIVIEVVLQLWDYFFR
jgi:required for meiotic nuclear division protein 1